MYALHTQCGKCGKVAAKPFVQLAQAAVHTCVTHCACLHTPRMPPFRRRAHKYATFGSNLREAKVDATCGLCQTTVIHYPNTHCAACMPFHTVHAFTHRACFHALCMPSHTVHAFTHRACLHALCMPSHTMHAFIHRPCLHTPSMPSYTVHAFTHRPCLFTPSIPFHTTYAFPYVSLFTLCMPSQTVHALRFSSSSSSSGSSSPDYQNLIRAFTHTPSKSGSSPTV